jgi:hypothetical protein
VTDYLPKTVRDALRGWQFVEELLRQLGEPSLLRLPGRESAFRLLLDLAWRNKFAIRAERADELCLGSVRVTAREGSVERAQVSLSASQGQWLAEGLDAGFWAAPVSKWVPGLKGDVWLLEVMTAGRYHAILRFSADEGEFRELGRRLVAVLAPDLLGDLP